MLNIKDKSECCGCYSCFNICPNAAISMESDSKGFKYPKINNQKCINCGLCEKVCPILNNKNTENKPKAYACINKNESIRMQSTSGGIFTLLAEEIIHKGGVVFGASFNDEFMVYHTYCENIDELKQFRGSKYLQSYIGDAYKKAKHFLDDDRYVLFTGTPCQIEGFKNFLLGKNYDKLFLQDIICHGVPSPLVWEKYKEYREQNANSSLTKISFRSKENTSWENYNVDMKFSNKSQYDVLHNNDVYIKAFLNHLTLRESCTNCHFKKNSRISDITLADFWGINNINSKFNDGKGTSLVIVNTDKGQKLLNEISDLMLYEEVDFEKAISGNPSYNTVSKANPKSEEFFTELKNNNDFEKVVNKYIHKTNIIKRLILKMKQILKKSN